MPVLEMAIVLANFYHGLRCFFTTENPTVATQLTSLNPQKSRNRRRQIVIGRSLRTSRRLRESQLSARNESVEFELSGSPISENFTASLSSSQELTRLEVMPRTSSAFLGRQQLQRRLRERPLILNAMNVLQVQSSHWWHTCWPALMAASVQISFGSSRLCHSLMGLYDEGECDPPILVLASNMGQYFKKLCQRTDIALSNAGPGPIYRTTSATMELIDIRELFQQINEALVNYLLTISDTEIFEIRG